MPATTLTEIFFGAAERYAGRPAVMRHKVDGTWRDISVDTLFGNVHQLYAGLHELGLTPGDRIAILSENRPEWAYIDFACLAARLADVPIYPTLTPEQMAYILRDSGARVIFVSSAAHLAKILEVRHELPELQHIVLIDGSSGAPGVITLATVMETGKRDLARHADWKDQALAVTPDDMATLIYTSGTTGEPKGVILSHGNIASNVVASLATLDVNANDEYLSFLPLCHIFERMVGHYTMLQAGAVITYSQGFDFVARELPDVRPTIVASVPRLYEKIFTGAADAAAKKGPLAHALFKLARRVGEHRIKYTLVKQPVPLLLAWKNAIADKLVHRKVRDRFGGRIKFLASGGAPLNPDICRFFLAFGLPLLEGYGLTETSPVISFNNFNMLKPGTVGPPIPGVELRIAPDGEILVRGPNIMKGYFHKPDATAEAIDSDGWFRTGDIGEIDSDGCLKITDRKKDLIKTSGGKYVAPQPIEGSVKLNPFFANAVLLGDRRKFPIMLLVPNFTLLEKSLPSGVAAGQPPAELIKNEAVRARIESEARRSLGQLAQFEMPKKFLIIANDFTIESGELTPTLKVKRKAVEANYAKEIGELYAE